MKVELENILDIGTELYSLDENFKIKRSRILWRLNGMVGFPFEEGVLTSLEHERLNVAFSIIRGVVQDSVESSIELGFNAKRRCTFGVCRKPAIEGSEYCREHKEYMEERQCQR